MTNKLIKVKTARMTTLEVLGGFLWLTISARYDKNSWPIMSEALYERWATEEWALHVAQIRVNEGYHVDVVKQVAFTIKEE